MVPPGCVDQEILLKALVRDCAHVPTPKPGSYEVSYPEFLEYFRAVPSLTKHHLIIAANFSYGWMPTILDFRSDAYDDAVGYLERARQSDDLEPHELFALSRLVNNSMVGASKLLHFASPSNYAIWDSRVAKYLGASPILGVRSGEQYAAYNDCCRSICGRPEASTVADRVGEVIGYRVHPMRAIELVMYHGGVAKRSCLDQ